MIRKNRRRSLLLTLCLLAGLATLAAAPAAAADVTPTSADALKAALQSASEATITVNASFEITGEVCIQANQTLKIASGCTVTIRGVNGFDGSYEYKEGSDGSAGLSITPDQTLTVCGPGALIIAGGNGGIGYDNGLSGRGGDGLYDYGTLIMTGGTLTVTGGYSNGGRSGVGVNGTTVTLGDGCKALDADNAQYATADDAKAALNAGKTLRVARLADTWAGLREALGSAGSVILTADVSAGDGDDRLEVPADTEVTLDLNGHVLDRALTDAVGDGFVLRVLGKLTLTDSAPDAQHDPAVQYTDPITGERVTVTGGVLTGGNNIGSGGGVYIGKDAAFIVSGGTIAGNVAAGDPSTTGFGGGVYVSEGAGFTMTGGAIAGNAVGGFSGGAGSHSGYGGGVYVYKDAAFIMSGGTIAGNVTPENCGGGVHINGGTFKLTGGTIKGNAVTGGGSGGGVYIDSIRGGAENHYGTFEMSGGAISGNASLRTGGGGVFVADGTFKLSGGTISGNTSRENGGGVCISDNPSIRFEVSGGATVTDNKKIEETTETVNNIFLPSGNTVTVAGALDDAARLGVTMGSPGVFTSGLSGRGTAAHFESDDTDFAVNLTDGGEAKLDARPRAAITRKPDANKRFYDGAAKPLLQSNGTAEGGTLVYALGDSETVAPANAQWSEDIPQGTDIKRYYVWVKAAGDTEHNDSAPDCVVSMICFPVTFHVEGGKWSDGTTEDKALSLERYENEELALVLTAEDVPAVGDKPDSGRIAGSWDVTPMPPEEAVSSERTFTYTYTQLPPADEPEAVFTATGADSGTLTGLGTDVKFSTDGGASWTDAAASSAELTGLAPCTISVVRKGDGTTTADSEARSIAVSRAAQPAGLAKTDCTTAADADGTVTGLDAGTAYEYRLTTAADYTPVPAGATALTGLAPGGYVVRVKAAGQTLASEDSAVLTVAAYQPPTFAVTVVNGSADKTSAEENDVVTVTANAPAAGKIFDKWTGDGVTFADETAAETTFTMPAQAVTVTANYTDEPFDDAPTDAPVTIPAADGAPALKVRVTGGAAAVEALTDAQLTGIAASDAAAQDVLLDLSSLGAGITDVSIPADTFAKLAGALAEHAGADTVTIQTAQGAITLDEKALGVIAARAAAGGNVELHFAVGMGAAAAETLSAAQQGVLSAARQGALAGRELLGVLHLTLQVGGGELSGFGGGRLTVTVPFTPPAGLQGRFCQAWCVPEAGQPEHMATAFMETFLRIRLTHLSDYALLYDPQPFTDVRAGDWYFDAVYECYASLWLNGTGEGVFSPETGMTRAMFATALWRLAGEPEAETACAFTDVVAGSWYARAAAWAAERGIVAGYGDGTFGVNDPITREQMAAMLYRFLQQRGQGFVGAWYFPLDYPDAAEISDWADEAVHYLVMQGVLNGMDGALNPRRGATRAQVAAILQRAAAMIEP